MEAKMERLTRTQKTVGAIVVGGLILRWILDQNGSGPMAQPPNKNVVHGRIGGPSSVLVARHLHPEPQEFSRTPALSPGNPLNVGGGNEIPGLRQNSGPPYGRGNKGGIARSRMGLGSPQRDYLNARVIAQAQGVDQSPPTNDGNAGGLFRPNSGPAPLPGPPPTFHGR